MSLEARDISVVVPVRDGERYLGEAIASILGQSTPAGEVIVVDDGSTDGTAQILESYGDELRVIRQPPMNQAAALNRGIAASSGGLIAFLDADDLWTPRSLEIRLEHLAADDQTDGVYGHLVQFVSPELAPAARDRLRLDPAPRAAPLLQALLIRREACDRVGRFDEELRTVASLEWLTRAMVLDFVEIADIVGHRRLHDANIGVTMAVERDADLLAVVRAHRARHRETGPTSETE